MGRRDVEGNYDGPPGEDDWEWHDSLGRSESERVALGLPPLEEADEELFGDGSQAG